MAHLLLLDVSSLMYRAHFALGEGVRSPAGRPVGAVHGYLETMRRLVPVNAAAPVDRWRGERDDAGLRELADELGIRGPVTRLRAALDSLG